MILDELQLIATISLDFYINNIKTINVKQYDTKSRYILVSFTEYGRKVQINRDTTSVFVRYRKRDNKYGIKYCEFTESGDALIETDEQMLAVNGKCTLDVLICESTGILVENFCDITSFEDLGCAVLSTMPFELNVIATPIQNAEFESTYDFSALNMALAQTKAAELDLIEKNKIWEEQENQRQENEVTRQQTFDTNEQNRQSTFESNEDNRNSLFESNETERQSNELQRQENETQREQNTQTAISNVNDATKNCITAIEECINTTNEKMTEVDSIMEGYAEAETVRNDDVTLAVSNCEDASERANTSAENAEIATEKALDAVELCKDYIDQTGVVLKSGSVMTGDLTVPTLNVTNIKLGNAILSYDTEQNRIVISYE